MQFDSHGKIFRNRCERGVQHFAVDPSDYFAEGKIGVATNHRFVRVFEARDGDQLAAASLFFERVAQYGSQNAVEPCPHPRLVAQLVEGPPCSHAGVLHHVFGITDRGRAPPSEAGEAIEVREHEGLEAGLTIGQQRVGGHGHFEDSRRGQRRDYSMGGWGLGAGAALDAARYVCELRRMTTTQTQSLGALLHAPLTVQPSLDALWMPFTNNRAFKAAPRLLVSAKDMHYRDAEGRTILDGVSGLWCVNAGHCRDEIVDAIRSAAGSLDYAPGFQMGHALSFELADRLSTILPAGIDRVFFTNSGSEAVDTALKMALAYHRARGEDKRVCFVGRLRGYHGVGFGGISVGGIAPNRTAFEAQLLPHVDHLAHTHDLARNAFSKGQPTYGAEFADDLERIIDARGGETIAAVIIEPVAGSTGVLIPPVGYLDRLRAICDAHGILLIFDEVITGFGRTGAPFASQRFHVTPDLITAAKGITNGAVPMGAVMAKREIHDTVVERAPNGIEFFHGYTYSGHPLAAAAALAMLDLCANDSLLTRGSTLEDYFESAVHSLRDKPNVIDVRNVGLVGAVEMTPRAQQPGARATAAFLECFKRGILIRQTGDTIAIAPPLIISHSQIDEIFTVLGDVLDDLA